jgi:putative acetyltransferase
MDIRPEIRSDERAIDELHRAAFGGPDEAAMVAGLREDPDAYLPELSLVAVEGGTVVGHVLFTIAHYVPDDDPEHETPILSLAPLAVLPARQDQGIGGRLVEVGLRTASRRPEPFCVVLGHPGYYPRFGFTRADELGIRCPFPGATDGAYMVRRLPGFRPVRTPGTVRYPDAIG